jgi:site-specific DNA-methyltransferase (adenine-specific)
MSESRILLGDCLQVLPEVAADSIAACITDPPYNYEFVGHKWDHAEIERRKAAAANSNTMVKHLPYGSGLAGGVRSPNWYRRNRDNILDYGKWTRSWAAEVFRVCKPGAYVAVFSSTRTAAHIQVALEDVGFYARDMLVFRRPSGLPKGFNLAAKLKAAGRDDAGEWAAWHSTLRSEWEAIVLVQKPLVTNYLTTFDRYGVGVMKAVNRDGGYQSNILEGYSARRAEQFNLHTTVKPLPLIEKLVEMLLPPGDDNIVLDPFAGSGTTLVAAAKQGRDCIGIELVPEYVEIIHQRLRDLAAAGDPSGGP